MAEVDKSYTVITGASQGIGKALALECAGRGMNLLLISRGNGLEELAVQIRERYQVVVHAMSLDLLSPDAGQQINAYCAEHDIRVSVLINNVGRGFLNPVSEAAPEVLRDVMYLNFITPVNVTKGLLDNLIANTPSHILFVGSLAGFFPVPYKSVYSASKAALLVFSRALQDELEDEDISTSILCPAAVPTNENTKDVSRSLGWRARMGMVSPEELARQAIEQMYKKKLVIIPRTSSRALIFLQRFMTQRACARISGMIFRHAYKKNIRY